MGSIGQTVAALVCPHLPWEWMFYVFGMGGLVWLAVWLFMYTEKRSTLDLEEEFVDPPKVNNNNVRWSEFVSHWPLWSVYIAHFSMNWSNYIIMQWLPTYMTRSLGASHNSIMFTAVPYLMNSLVGVDAMWRFVPGLVAPPPAKKPKLR
nr:hypothetical protein BaRGS_026260 [Batillaria attramentaria]